MIATGPSTTAGMRTVVLAPRLPLPPRGGGDLRVLQAINGAVSAGPAAVFCLRGEQAPAPRLMGVDVWRCSDDASISDPPATAAAALRWLRGGTSHPYDRFLTDSTAAELDALVKEFRPQAAIVETLSMYRYVEFLKDRGLPVVLDAHDVETPLQKTMLESRARTGGVPPLMASRLADRLEAVERAAFRTADQIWACSRRDAGLIDSLFPGSAPVEVIPNTIDLEFYEQPNRASEREPHSIVFSGAFGYPPNAEAAMSLAREVLPRLVDSFPDARLVLVGAAPTAEMLAVAHDDSRITVTGPVPDVRPYLASASVMAVPILVGGGTRFKVLEAFASGLPVVSTAKGVEGLDLVSARHYLAGETPEAFASAVAVLWSDPPLGRKLVAHALAHARELYSWPVAAQRIREGLGRLGRASAR